MRWVVVKRERDKLHKGLKMMYTQHTCDQKLAGQVTYMQHTRFPRLLETLEKPGIYFGSLNPQNSLEFCIKTLNPLEICERHKNRSTQISFSLSKFHTVLSSTFFLKIIDISLERVECCIDQKKSSNKCEKLLEILFTYSKVTTVFQKYPWNCAVDPLITLEISLNFLIWDVWEPWTH